MTDNLKPDRRAFLATAGAAGFMFVKPQSVRGSQANSAVRVGLLGCGGRGTVDATSIAINGPARIVALADLFEDRLVTAKKHFDEVASETTSRRRRRHSNVSRPARSGANPQLRRSGRRGCRHAALFPPPAPGRRGGRRQARLLRKARGRRRGRSIARHRNRQAG